MSVRPCSIVRKPSMWSNDLFSIIRTTMWSILRRFWSASVTGAPGKPTVPQSGFAAEPWLPPCSTECADATGRRRGRQPRSGDGQLDVHPGLLVARDRAVDVVGPRLQVDVQRRRLARGDRRCLLVHPVALHHEVVRDMAVVLDVEVVRAGRERVLGKRDLELGLADGQ